MTAAHTSADDKAPIAGLRAHTPAGSIGVYVHFPWCLQKCPYCDFVSYGVPRDAIDHPGYADAVLAELEARAPALAGRRLATVFFGGGTPSLWEPRELGRVLRAVQGAGAVVADDLEVTVECNPSSLDEDRARALLDVGVNRLSVGVQGLDADRLRFLGRLHDPGGGLAALHAAIRAGTPRVSGDLIFAVASGRGAASTDGANAVVQSPAEAADEARRVADTGVGHISAYGLTIEPGTRFGELAKRGRLPLASDEVAAESFLAIEEALARFGLEHYEVSNYARPGDEARHNLGYWRGDDYLGLGCAAYGTLSREDGSARRYRNPIDPGRYAAAAHAATRPTVATAPTGAIASDEDETLDPEARLRERIMLGLRLRVGLDLEVAAASLGVDPWPRERVRAAERLAASGRLSREGSRLTIPASARLFTDGIAASLF